jgi:phage gp36-like protein
MAFASANDLTNRYDYRLIGDLCSDEMSELTLGQVLAEAKVSSALDDAAGEIVVGLQTGGNYTEEDLNELDGLNQSHLIRVNCDLAMCLLIQRRPNRVNIEVAEKICEAARGHLNRLRKGENIFGIPAKVEAGNLSVSHMSAMQLESLNLIPDRMARYFPGQGQRQRGAW